MSARFGFRSEFAPLEAVLLHKPGPGIAAPGDPAAVLHLRAIDSSVMEREYAGIRKIYEGLGVEAHWIDPLPVEAREKAPLYNLMYARDLFFMAPRGAVLARPALPIRRGEPAYAAKALEAAGVPLAGAVEGEGTFEGADALWAGEKLVAVGVGNRTNREGFQQLRKILRIDGIDCAALPPSRGTPHLLGAMQFVDAGRALVRTSQAEAPVMALLKERGIEIIPVPESDEVVGAQAMNVVAAAPGRLIMPAGCPRTRELYEGAGLEVAAEAEISQLVNGGGGIACATGILRRS